MAASGSALITTASAAFSFVVDRFNQPERDKLAYLISYCKAHLGTTDSTIPLEFTTDKEGNSTFHVDRISFHSTYWEPLVGPCILREKIMAMIGKICAFQMKYTNTIISREQYTFIILSEFLKKWIKDNIAGTRHPKDMCLNAKKILNFIQAIEVNPLFCEQKLLSMLVKFRRDLELTYIPTFEAEAKRTSAETDLSYLNGNVKILLDYCVRYLYYILQDTKILNHNEIMLDSLIAKAHSNTETRALDPVMSTAAGTLLVVMLCEPLFSADANNSSNNNIFTTSPDKISIPSVILKKQKNSEDIEAIQQNPILFFEIFKRDLGLIPDLCRPEVLKDYLQLYKLVFELARFINYFSQSVELAKRGGDILVYGFANGQGHFSNLLTFFYQLLNKITHTISRLDSAMDDYYYKCISQDETFFRSEVKRPWAMNRRASLHWKASITNVTQTCLDHIQDIQRTATSMSLEERLQEAERETKKFILHTAQLTRQLAGVLQIPVPENLRNFPLTLTSPFLLSAASSTSTSTSETSQPPIERQRLYYRKHVKEGEVNKSVLLDNDIPTLPLAGAYELDLSRQSALTKLGLSCLFERIALEAPELRKLNLHGVLLGDDGAIELSKIFPTLTSLTELDLYGCQIGPNGITILTAYLADCSLNLKRFDASDNPLGDSGIEGACNHLRRHPSLHTVKLYNVGFAHTGANALCRLAWENPKILKLDVNEENNPEITTIVKEKLRALIIDNLYNTATAGFSPRGAYRDLIKLPAKSTPSLFHTKRRSF